MFEILPDKETVKILKRLESAHKRLLPAIERFVKLALQELADDVKANHPQPISVTGGEDGGPLSYADLELVDMSDIEQSVTFAVVLPIGARTLTAQETPIAAVYVHPTGQSDLLDALQRYSPWPVDLLPAVPTETEARLVIRITSEGEINDLRSRLLGNEQLATDLTAAGFAPSSDKTRKIDRVVEEDIGWRIVREEFGLGGGTLSTHWRPALKSLKSPQSIASAALKYIVTGDDDGLLDLDASKGPPDKDPVFWFQDKISNT